MPYQPISWPPMCGSRHKMSWNFTVPGTSAWVPHCSHVYSKYHPFSHPFTYLDIVLTSTMSSFFYLTSANLFYKVGFLNSDPVAWFCISVSSTRLSGFALLLCYRFFYVTRKWTLKVLPPPYLERNNKASFSILNLQLFKEEVHVLGICTLLCVLDWI